MPGARKVPGEGTGPELPELELQMTVSYRVGIGNQPESFARAPNVPNHIFLPTSLLH